MPELVYKNFSNDIHDAVEKFNRDCKEYEVVIEKIINDVKIGMTTEELAVKFADDIKKMEPATIPELIQNSNVSGETVENVNTFILRELAAESKIMSEHSSSARNLTPGFLVFIRENQKHNISADIIYNTELSGDLRVYFAEMFNLTNIPNNDLSKSQQEFIASCKKSLDLIYNYTSEPNKNNPTSTPKSVIFSIAINDCLSKGLPIDETYAKENIRKLINKDIDESYGSQSRIDEIISGLKQESEKMPSDLKIFVQACANSLAAKSIEVE